MKRNTPRHPKTRDLAKRLAVPRCTAVGLLELLWHATAQLAPRGNIGQLDDDHIAEELFWDGNPEALIDALVAAGWLDLCSVHRLVVHDWQDHADQTVKRSKSVQDHGFVSAVRETSRTLATDEQETSVPGTSLREPVSGNREPVSGNQEESSAGALVAGATELPAGGQEVNGLGKHRRLLNLLSKRGKDPTHRNPDVLALERKLWLTDTIDQLESEASSTGRAIKDVAVAFWTRYLGRPLRPGEYGADPVRAYYARALQQLGPEWDARERAKREKADADLESDGIGISFSGLRK